MPARKLSPRQRRANLTQSIKSTWSDFDGCTKKLARIRCTLFQQIYEWVQAGIEEEAFGSAQEGIERLAKTLKRSAASVNGHYYSGAFMADHKINPVKADGRAVRTVYNKARALQKHELLRCVSIVREYSETSFQRVKHILEKSRVARMDSARKKTSGMIRQRKLNKKALELESLALLTMARGLYGDTARVVVYAKGKKQIESK